MTEPSGILRHRSQHSQTPDELRVEQVKKLIAMIQDSQERSLVQAVLDTYLENRKMPSWKVCTPLMTVAISTLEGTANTDGWPLTEEEMEGKS